MNLKKTLSGMSLTRDAMKKVVGGNVSNRGGCFEAGSRCLIDAQCCNAVTCSDPVDPYVDRLACVGHKCVAIYC